METEGFNFQRISRMARVDPNTMREVIDLFVEDTRENMKKLRPMLTQTDIATSGETAHALKPSIPVSEE